MTSAAELPASVGAKNLIDNESNDKRSLDPVKAAAGVYVTVHGHFYQPPRENPYLNAIERQPGAAPFHEEQQAKQLLPGLEGKFRKRLMTLITFLTWQTLR